MEPEPVGGGCFLAPWNRRRLKKKPGAGAAKKKSEAGAAKELAGSSALLEDKKHKEIVLLLLFFRQISKFLWLNKQIFYLFYNFCSFTLLVALLTNQKPEPEP